jgi:disulfide bond formation protein DsbB
MTIFSTLFGTFRRRAAWGAAVAAIGLGIALLSQHVWGLNPCPLCIFQRIALAAAGAVFLLAALWAPPRRFLQWVLSLGAAAAALIGAGIAGRHVWLQSLPPSEVPSCGPGLSFLMDAFPLKDAVAFVLSGSGECAAVEGAFLGLSMPGWTLVLFAGLVVWALALPTWKPWPVRFPLPERAS